MPVAEPLGLLGFSNIPGKGQALRYDAENGQISGELQMYADASFLNALAEPAWDGENHAFETPVVPTTAAIRISLEEPLNMADEPRRVPAKLELALRTQETRDQQIVFPDLAVRLFEPVDLIIDIGPIRWLEVKQRLCVQPVRITRLQVLRGRFGFPLFVFQSTGEGLAFGEPGARAEWDKADVVFQIREWKSLFAPAYWDLDSTEARTVSTAPTAELAHDPAVPASRDAEESLRSFNEILNELWSNTVAPRWSRSTGRCSRSGSDTACRPGCRTAWHGG